MSARTISHSTSSIVSSILVTALTPRASQSAATRLIALQKLGPPTMLPRLCVAFLLLGR
jgi:hypothetical protein